MFSLNGVCSGYDHVPIIREAKLEIPQGKLMLFWGVTE